MRWCYFCLLSPHMLFQIPYTPISHPRGPWIVICDTVKEGKCSAGGSFYYSKSIPLLLKAPQTLGRHKNPIYCKYPEFLKLSKPIYFEFLRHLQTLCISDSNTQGGSESCLRRFNLPPAALSIHTHTCTHTYIHTPPAMDSRSGI